MNKDYYIKNFKVFDEEESYIDIRPITILTGCNNSGKSSIVKSLCLLNDFCRQADKSLSKSEFQDLSKIVLDFHKRPNDIMGSFSKVIHKTEHADNVEGNAEAKSSKTFSLKANAYSNYFLQNMFVELTFSNRKGDYLDNGYLRKIEISTKEGEVVYSSEIGCDSMYNFNSLKSSLMISLLVNRFINNFKEQCMSLSALEDGYINPRTKESFLESLRFILKHYDLGVCSKLFRWSTTQINDDNTNTIQFHRILDSSIITNDFFNAFELNVFVYFPFMWKYKDSSIQDLRNLFREGLSAVKCEQYEIDFVERLFENVENSKSESLLEYVRNAEKYLFALSCPSFILGKSFLVPYTEPLINDEVEEYVEIPDVLKFGQIMFALNKINYVLTGDKNSYITDGISDINYFIDVPDILSLAIQDILKNIIPGDLIYSRTEGVSVKRLYALDDVSDFAELLKDYFNKSSQISNKNGIFDNSYEPIREYQPGTFLKKWVKELGLAHHVEIIPVADGLGASIRMYSSENDNEGMLLADMGYGSTQLFMTILKIENAILDSVKMYNKNRCSIQGFGDKIVKLIGIVSYLFNNPITVSLEEPENHLHPSLQSKLADMLVDAHKSYEVQFLVETHSEYLIRKLQLLIARETIENDSVSILYVNGKNRPSYMPLVKSISVDKDGNLEDVFGPGFFDESVRLSKELFHLNIKDDEEQN